MPASSLKKGIFRLITIETRREYNSKLLACIGRLALILWQLIKTGGRDDCCLPTLATIPVWIGLYQALSNVANEGLLIEVFFWIPSLGGPTTIAARQSGSGISWLIPFLDGHPQLGWHDTAAYLVLPVLLVVSQYVSMELMKPPQTDPAQKNTLLVLKFLPLMIGYFSLSVPSGLSIY
ncbi:inner membrane protein PPF-1, chloroplastic-like [Hibiscus syriacus]|uniref:inner membrane protein PPF-1, chloroplastic-like n=1 Tax=Hibiscus syriacus TaxID=106335 RepID=UPI0019213FAB|nr:inner membrane protein PPF-1, chloroplastic-like [Hibiscus syriacus]